MDSNTKKNNYKEKKNLYSIPGLVMCIDERFNTQRHYFITSMH
jgi:hypothetical protein